MFARSFDRVAGWLRADPPLDPVKIVVELAAASGDLPTRKRRAGARGESIRDYLIAKGLAAGRFEIENNSASEPLGDSVRIQGSQRN